MARMILPRTYQVALVVAVLFVFGLILEVSWSPTFTSSLGPIRQINPSEFSVNQGDKVYVIDSPLPTSLNTSFKEFTAVHLSTFQTSEAELLVVDLAFRNLTTNKIRINRRIISGERHEIYISELPMVVPDNILETNPYDTTHLSVDYSKLSGVGRTLVAPPFLMGSLSTDPDRTSNVLVIGLGGSQLNNFIHFKFPRMNITVIELEQSMVDNARRYCGLKEDATQRVIVMDGVRYLQDAAQQGLKFDAIYIDVCPTKFPHNVTVMCPIALLLNDTTIRHIRQCLTDNGTMISKMLVFTPQVLEEAERVADLYRKHFANCIVTPMPNFLNRVLVCSAEKVPGDRFDLNVLSESMLKLYQGLGVID